MSDPFAILNVAPDSDDETIRRRYLELVRTYPPEQFPERFAAIRQAYENLRDLETRLRYRLFEAGEHDTLDSILEEMLCRIPRRRLPLKTLLSLLKPSPRP